MSSEQTSNADLRSTAQDSKRAAAHKHKWHLGSVERVGRGAGNPRPHRPSETIYNMKRRETKGAVASLAHGTKIARKRDILEEPVVANSTSDESSGLSSDNDEGTTSPPPDAGVMYSFDAPRGPSHGSEILNVALAKAVKKFEEKETARIVKTEYDVIDSEGESIGLPPIKKGKGKAKAESPMVLDGEDDYEFV